MLIQPSLVGGFRDYLPRDMIPRQRMFDTIRGVFERFGFVPLDTPGIEKKEVLTGGDPDFKMHIFNVYLRGSSERDELALRFDLTVPLARVIAMYQSEISRPFKRYQVGKVWRGEKQQAGRFREFVQFDADIVGSKSMQADAEVVALMYEVMTALGFSKFRIRVNNRKILNGLAEYAGFDPERSDKVLRIIDKLDKQGWEAVKIELMRSPEGDEPGVSLEAGQVTAIRKFLDVKGDSPESVLRDVESLMSKSSQAMEGTSELRELTQHVRALGVPDDKWTIDLSVARGLGYYTGPVFETMLTELPSIGSVFSGGRYDDLVSRFSNMNVPATGASVGVDRLFAAMEKMGLVKQEGSVAKVILLNFDPRCALYLEEVATNLRRSGIATEIYFGPETTLKGQLSYAVKQSVPFVLIAGSKELERGVVQLKDLAAREQVEVPRTDIAEILSARLSGG